MKKKVGVFLFLSLIFFGLGCASQSKRAWKSEPNTRQIENEYFYAAISPIFMFDGYKGFLLTIHSKTAKSIEIQWNKTFYLHDGQRNGDFMPEGVPYSEIRKSKPSDIITQDRLYQKEIFPSKLAEMSSMAKAWIRNPMKPGENGVELTVKVGRQEMTEKLTLIFSEQ
jgi:hypothetical protein